LARSLEHVALALDGIRREVDARRLEPMRPVLGRPSLTRAGWIFELKLDGYRLLADVRGRDVALRYRSGRDCTRAFPELAEVLLRMRAPRLVLDGEVVAFDEQGRPDFDRLGPRLQRSAERKPPVVYMLFDVLAVGDVDVRPVPLVARKQLVELVVERSRGALRAVPYVADDGRAIHAFVVQHQLEGLVAKRGDSPYVEGLSSTWVKAKQRREEEFIVTRCRRNRDGKIDALALATVQGQKPRGIVELGAWRVGAAFEKGAPARGGWASVEASIRVTVTFSGLTSAGRLREARVKGIRVGALR
jgi:bifunctional non-homologous end joining protein LigD